MESPALPGPHRWGVGVISYLIPSPRPVQITERKAAKHPKIKAFLACQSITPEKSETKLGKSKGYFGNAMPGGRHR